MRQFMFTPSRSPPRKSPSLRIQERSRCSRSLAIRNRGPSRQRPRSQRSCNKSPEPGKSASRESSGKSSFRRPVFVARSVEYPSRGRQVWAVTCQRCIQETAKLISRRWKPSTKTRMTVKCASKPSNCWVTFFHPNSCAQRSRS